MTEYIDYYFCITLRYLIIMYNLNVLKKIHLYFYINSEAIHNILKL